MKTKHLFFILLFIFGLSGTGMTQELGIMNPDEDKSSVGGDKKKRSVEILISSEKPESTQYEVGVGYTRSKTVAGEYLKSKTGVADSKFIFYIPSGIYYYAVREVLTDSTLPPPEPVVKGLIISPDQDRVTVNVSM